MHFTICQTMLWNSRSCSFKWHNYLSHSRRHFAKSVHAFRKLTKMLHKLYWLNVMWVEHYDQTWPYFSNHKEIGNSNGILIDDEARLYYNLWGRKYSGCIYFMWNTYYVYSISFENIHKSNFCFQKHILSQLLRLPDHLENSIHILKLHSAAFNIDTI